MAPRFASMHGDELETRRRRLDKSARIGCLVYQPSKDGGTDPEQYSDG